MKLQDQVAIVTGGGVRIGRALAVSLARAGCRVVIHCAHSRDEAEQVREEIIAAGGTATVIAADFNQPIAAAAAVFQATHTAFGPASILINSAAIFEAGSLHDLEESQWDRHFAINLKAVAFLSRAFVEQLPPGQRGHIVNIADWRARRPQPGHLAYTLTKAGVVALTEILAQELAPRVQVNAIAPGAILPPPGAGDDHLRRLAETIPLRRTGSPDDLCEALHYLLKSDFVTGELLHVTGGEQL